MFPKLQIGKEVTLKFKSNVVDEIIVTNRYWFNFTILKRMKMEFLKLK